VLDGRCLCAASPGCAGLDTPSSESPIADRSSTVWPGLRIGRGVAQERRRTNPTHASQRWLSACARSLRAGPSAFGVMRVAAAAARFSRGCAGLDNQAVRTSGQRSTLDSRARSGAGRRVAQERRRINPTPRLPTRAIRLRSLRAGPSAFGVMRAAAAAALLRRLCGLDDQAVRTSGQRSVLDRPARSDRVAESLTTDGAPTRRPRSPVAR
jgi:hypothetical protein